MANTVSLLSYANTFGDQMVITNALVNENNTLATGNYSKKTGTLLVSDPSLALQANGPVLLYNTLQSLGLGSSVSIQNNLAVTSGQVYFQNTTLGLINSGQLISNGIITASGSGLGLNVANNTQIGGFLAVTGNTSVVGPVTMANTLAVTGATSIANTLSVTGATTLGSTLSVTNNASFYNSINVLNNAAAYNLIANNNTNTSTLSVTTTATIGGTTTIGGSASIAGTAWANVIQANTSVNTATLSVTGSSYTNLLQANSSVNTATLSVTGSSYTNLLQANSSVNTATLSVTGSSYTNVLQANSSVNTAIVTSTGNIIGQNLKANGQISATTSNITGTEYVGTVAANTLVSTPYLSVVTEIDANSAAAFVGSLQTLGQLSVGGNFVINGTTVYSSNAFTLNAGSNTGSISTFGVNRGSSGANAAIRWNEPSTYFDIKDVSSNTYYRILTTQQITDNLISTSTNTAASANAANALNTFVNASVVSLQGQITSNVTSLQSQITSNVTSLQSQIASNSAISGAGITAAYARANSSSQSFVGTTGTAAPTNPAGVVTFTSTNGITITGSGSTLTINDPQNLQTAANPTFNNLGLNNLTLTNALPIAYGGTGATSSGAALTSLLPSAVGVTAGYVLATGGVGSYYWTAGGSGGGGGTTPGTTISSTRQTYTGNGSGLSYQTPTYITGDAQIRIYINGVRQNPSEYTETSGNTSGVGIITFGTPPQPSDVILFEVDGYIVNPYYANNIPYTVNATIGSTANTIQLAIDGLASIAAPKASPALTGTPTSVTASIGTSNTVIATTGYVNNLANSGFTFASSITGNAGTVTNGLYSSSSYANPAWLTQIPGSIVNGGVAYATSANTVAGYSPQTSPSSSSAVGLNQYPRSDGSGNMYFNYINSNTDNSENPTVSQVIVTKGTDNFYRKSSIASFTTQLTGTASSLTAGSATTANIASTVSIQNGRTDSTFYPALWGTGGTGTLVYASAASGVTIQSSSYGGIGFNNSTWQLTGSVSYGLYTNTGLYTAGQIWSASNITAYYSDERLKTKLGNISNALAKVQSLNGFVYVENELARKNGYNNKQEQVGLSAQEVQKVIPQAVSLAPFDMTRENMDGEFVSKSGENYLTVDYSRLVPLLVEAIKELKAEIDTLKGNK